MSTTSISRLSVQPWTTHRAAKPLPRSRYVSNIYLSPLAHPAGHLAAPARRASHITQFKHVHATAAELNKRQSDLATRTRYLTNFWYAASFTKKISHSKPVATTLLDTDVLLWRDDNSGEVVCITATDPVTLQNISEKNAHLTVYTSEGAEETAMYASSIDTQPSTLHSSACQV